MKKYTIGVFRALKLGDMICAIPSLVSIRESYPDAQIILITLPWVKDLLLRYSDIVDEVVETPYISGLPETYSSSSTIPRSKKPYDLLIQLHGSGLYSNRIFRIFNYVHGGGFWTGSIIKNIQNITWVPYPTGLTEERRLLLLVNNLGIPESVTPTPFPLLTNEVKWGKILISKYKIENSYVVIHPGADSGKRIAAATLARLASILWSMGFVSIITGTAKEKKLAGEIALQSSVPLIDLTGKTDIGKLAAIIAGSRAFFSADTGPAHLAHILKVPSLTVFLSTDMIRWRSKERHNIIIDARGNLDELKLFMGARKLLNNGLSPMRNYHFHL